MKCSTLKKILSVGIVLVMCIPAFSEMNVSGEKANKEEATAVMELPDLENWHYRIPIIVDTGDYNRTDCVLSQTINVSREIGGFGTFDPKSIRVIETLEDGTPEYESISQIRWLNIDNLDVEWIMNGTTPANTQRYYSIYFDILENGAKNATTYTEYVTTKENSQQIWVYGTDYEIKIDKNRGGSREVKINNVPRKGYTLDKDWMSWYTQHINCGIKGANTTLVEDGPIYKTVKIVSSDNTQTIHWCFYPDRMKIVTEDEYDDVCFDTIADNLNNKKGTLIWSNGTTGNLTKDYKEYSGVTDFFYILDPELDSSNDDVKGRSGFWADTIDGKNQTVINAGEKGTRWILGGSSAWFGFAKNEIIRDTVIRSQNPPEITREYSWVVLESPVIEDEKVFENQVVIIKGNLTVKDGGTFVSVGSSLVIHGNITIEEGGEFYIVSTREDLPPKPPELPPLPPRPPRPPIRPPIRSVTVAGNISVNGKLFIAKDTLSICGEKDRVNGIYVNSIGTLESYNATITTFSGEIPVSITNQKVCYERSYYNFDIYGEAQIDSSKISYLYDGIRILNGSDVFIQNSHISDSAGNGIFIDENCTPTIKDNIISDCGNAGIFIDPPMSNEDESQNSDNPPVQDNSTNSSNVVEAVNITYYDGYMEILFSDGSTMIVPYQPVEHNSTNFILNGDFSDGLNHWTKWGGSRYGSWSDEIVYDGGNYPHVLEYQVWNSRADGSGTGVYQPLNIDVTTYSSIYLECEVKVISNTLTDSGWWSYYYGGGGEMPGHIWITYKDFNNEDWVWSHGFLPNSDRFNRRNLHRVVRDQWYPYQSPNLVNEDTTTTKPYNQAITGHKMKTITGINVGGNGWDFKGRFDCVKLWGEEIGVNQPPVAKVDIYQKTGEVNKNVGFKGSGTDSDGSIAKYEWDFNGDGVYDWSSSTSASTTHAYNVVGTYFPVLRVTDNMGATDTDYLRVNVWDSSAWTISGNTIKNCEYGVYTYEEEIHFGPGWGFIGVGRNPNIVNFTIYNNTYGIYSFNSTPTIKESRIFFNSEYDIRLCNSRPTVINSSYDRRKVYAETGDLFDRTKDITDTDNDGWYDWQELYVYGFNPYMEDEDKENSDADFDGDGFTNVKEGENYGTDALNPDTDGDEINDWDEVNGIKPFNPLDFNKDFTYKTSPFNPDTDLDGQNDSADLIPLDYDMDGDGKINSLEIITSSSSYYVDRLAIAANNDPNLMKSAGVFAEDDDMDGDGLKVSFSNGFETADLWVTEQSSSTSVVQRTNVKSHSGSYSVEVYQTKDDGDTVLERTLSIQQRTGVVTFWFYDNTGVSGTQIVGIKSDAKEFWIGIKGGATSKYYYRIDSSWYSTAITRSTGWHKMMFVATGGYVRGLIDNTVIKTTAAIKTFNRVEIGSYWTVSGAGLYFDDVIINDDYDNDNDGMDDGYETGYGVANQGWQNPYIYNARYAILVVGGGTSAPTASTDGNQDAFWSDITGLYNKLLNDYNYNSENVYLLYSYWRDTDHSGDSRIDGECTWNVDGDFGIDDAIIEVGEKITMNDFLFFVEACHGYDSDAIEISDGNQHGYYLSYADISSSISQNFGGKNSPKKYARMSIILQSCWSGKGINDLAGEDRIVMSATNDDELSYTRWALVEEDGDNHFAFLYGGSHMIYHVLWWEDEFHPGVIPNFGSISNPNSLKYMFDKGYDAATNNYRDYKGDPTSHPQLDDNGDGFTKDDGYTDDGYLAEHTYL